MSGGNKKLDTLFSQRPVLNVAPLNSMPYIDPTIPNGDDSQPTRENITKSEENVGPSVIFLPSCTTRREWDDILLLTKSGVGLTGSAALGKVGPIIRLLDIQESEDYYLFRVSLPGVARDEKNFSWLIEPDGKILINGVTTTGEQTVCKNSQIFRMQSQNLCPPGRFSITFHLPGPVHSEHFKGHFGTDGIFEGLVRKKR